MATSGKLSWFRVLRRKFLKAARSGDDAPGTGKVQDLRQKEAEVYGREAIALQRLYEKWSVRNSWNLKTQALPLLLATDPEVYSRMLSDVGLAEQHRELWEHAKSCVERGLLAVIDATLAAEDWEVEPKELYKWAEISRVEFPRQLSALMEFVIRTTGDDGGVNQAGVGTEERVLGAALAVLAVHPQGCKDQQGRISAEKIFSLVQKHGNILFGLSSAPATDSEVIGQAVIKRWLEKGGALKDALIK